MNKKNTDEKEKREKLKQELKKEILQEIKNDVSEENEKISKKTVTTNNKHKDIENLDEIKYNILWKGKPCGLFDRLLTKLNLNFTTYQITKDELIIITGFLKRKLNSYELYLLKDPDLSDNIYQRLLNISTISVRVDTHTPGVPTKIIKIKNIEEGSKVRKLLRDAIEADVIERQIKYFDKV